MQLQPDHTERFDANDDVRIWCGSVGIYDLTYSKTLVDFAKNCVISGTVF